MQTAGVSVIYGQICGERVMAAVDDSDVELDHGSASPTKARNTNAAPVCRGSVCGMESAARLTTGVASVAKVNDGRRTSSHGS